MRRLAAATLGILLGIAALSPAHSQPGGSTNQAPPTVYIDVSYEPTISRIVVQDIQRLFREEASNRSDWRSVTPVAGLTFHHAMRNRTRDAFVEQTRKAGARYGTSIRLSKQQTQFGLVWLSAQAWTVSADSSAYVLVTESMWTPEDTTAQKRQLRLLLDRMIPRTSDAFCYYELFDVDTRRSESGAVVSTEAAVRVLGPHLTRLPDAQLAASWRINGRRAEPVSLTTGPDGVARVTYVAGEDEPAIGTILLGVDSIDCNGAVYDPQWPQREVDEAVALLENARADLDESGDYKSALRRAQEFLSLTEDDLSWYSVLTNPPNAPNRRQQAEYLMRRARSEQRRAGDLSTESMALEERWGISFWAGFDILSPSEGDITATTEVAGAGPGITVSVESDRVFSLGAEASYRMTKAVWLASGVSYGGGDVVWKSGNALNRTVSRWSIQSSIRYYSDLPGALSLFGDGTLRISRRTSDSNGPWYVENGVFTLTPTTQVAYPIEDDTGAFYPGLIVGGGVAVRRGDFTPTRTDVGLYSQYDRLPGGRTAWGVSARVRVTFLR